VLAMAEAITGHSIRVEVNPAFVRANEVKTLCGDSSRLRFEERDSPGISSHIDKSSRAPAGQ